jgi:hypothetical protein
MRSAAAGKSSLPMTLSPPHSSTPLTAVLALQVAVVQLMALGACENKPATPNEAPPRLEQAMETQHSAGATAGASAAAASPAPSSAPAPGMNGRPSLDENMGRGFQGALVLRLSSPGAERTLSYRARGNTARIQIDTPQLASPQVASLNGAAAGSGAAARPIPAHFDALLYDNNLSVLDHEQRTYRTTRLDAIEPVGGSEPNLELKKTGERLELQGVMCERYEMAGGPLRISTCVSPLPGTFDVDKFEAVTSLPVPAWVAQLLKREMMPLTASVKDNAGRELYSLQLLEYSPGPVDESQLAIPSSYRAAERPGNAATGG